MLYHAASFPSCLATRQPESFQMSEPLSTCRFPDSPLRTYTYTHSPSRFASSQVLFTNFCAPLPLLQYHHTYMYVHRHELNLPTTLCEMFCLNTLCRAIECATHKGAAIGFFSLFLVSQLSACSKCPRIHIAHERPHAYTLPILPYLPLLTSLSLSLYV